MTKNEYLKSLVDSKIPGDKWFDLVRQWEKDNTETEEVSGQCSTSRKRYGFYIGRWFFGFTTNI
jgi:hypothetical protein